MKKNFIAIITAAIFLAAIFLPVVSYARGGGGGGGGFGGGHASGMGGYGIQSQTKSMDQGGQHIGAGEKHGKTYGPGDGTGNAGEGPKDGTGYGSPSNR
ncbi:MAG TPA: hypothetical protein PK864_06950 [Syntrophorhabdaceae bacterium]|nr:hypothetical protein [Syntrophorhabdaceae bacterium]HOL05311.1 hypothetical protein [Syntrophorhabdaceae bacterium]HON85750.1 hypothetical protein [Syntrophorhabdaceae bacterium]HOT42076.1 hypothetical protein [Syntrophorhabdaceae bacterium]HPC66053.1 hypothetical protein [Syntrophorhabdaceae bacterium]